MEVTMNTVIQISILIVAVAILVLVVFTVPILLDLRRVIKNWKKVSQIVELGIAPITWGASIVLDIFRRLLEIGEEKREDKPKS